MTNWTVQSGATESRGTAEIFTAGDFNLSSSSATWTPSATANGGFDVCTSNFSLFNTTAASQVLLNHTDYTLVTLGAPHLVSGLHCVMRHGIA